ncbi:response regulator [Roseateles sp. DAIF2]|uniref:ATP-binding protein n=1 Tax=Roseateles sp. DAIF2 TaxID=2714952 RepID=UPI0018A329B8|nr:ATP-binding protein [Roseateles sp. DAIF2]QPF73534.1 response regulator [Roseateles sp. DAIF2]
MMTSAEPQEDGGNAAQADRIAQQVGAESLAALYDMTPAPTAVGLLFCCFPVIWLWPHLPHGLLLGWLGARALISALRCLDVLQFRRARPAPGQHAAWQRRYMALLALDALSWGALGWWFHSPALPELDGIILASLVGLGAISLFSLGSVWRAHLLFSTLAFAPLLAYHLSLGRPADLFVAAGLSLFLGVSLFESRRVQARHGELLRLRFENAWIAEQREQALQSAERNSSSKSRFVAMMSHEIRTPLNGILGITQLLERSELAPEQREQVHIVRRSGRHLLTLINDILDLARIESGKLVIEPAALQLREAVDDVCQLLAAGAREKGLDFRLQCSPTLPGCVVGDAARIKQVLHNLVGNAIKFTEAGSVTVEVGTVLDMRAGTLLRFAVRDTGEGIPADQMERVFAPFEQAERSYRLQSPRPEGTGLGLTISRELARAMGGDLRCCSSPGQGSTFEFTLPLQVCADARPSGPEPAPLTLPRLAGRVLLVDDSPVNLLVAASMLERFGLAVDQAEDGLQALERMKAGAYDLVLMDCQMPELDGFEATQSWRAHERRQGLTPLPIVALTASAVNSDRQRCLDAGMDDYLVKPFEMADLLAMVQRHLRQPQPA